MFSTCLLYTSFESLSACVYYTDYRLIPQDEVCDHVIRMNRLKVLISRHAGKDIGSIRSQPIEEFQRHLGSAYSFVNKIDRSKNCSGSVYRDFVSRNEGGPDCLGDASRQGTW